DVATDDGARLLKCFVWADQTQRLDRMTRAIDVVRAEPPDLVSGDIAEQLPHVLEDVPTLVFQTAVFGYVDEPTRAAVKETFSRARFPLAFVSAGGGRTWEHVWGMRVVSYPSGEREFLGHADYHGAW